MRKPSLQQMVSCLVRVGGRAGEQPGLGGGKGCNDIQTEIIEFRMECQECNCATLNPARLYSIRTEF